MAIRVILTIAFSKNWCVRQSDVNNVFINGDIKEEVYITQPSSFENPKQPKLVCRLHKALYRLKKAPKVGFKKLHGALASLGFTSIKSYQSLFVRITPQHCTYLLVYVDDILITGNYPQVITSLIADLNNAFALKDLGELKCFIGIQVTKTSLGLHLS